MLDYSLAETLFEITDTLPRADNVGDAFWALTPGERSGLSGTLLDLAVACGDHLDAQAKEWADFDFYLVTEALAAGYAAHAIENGSLYLTEAECSTLVAEAFRGKEA